MREGGTATSTSAVGIMMVGMNCDIMEKYDDYGGSDCDLLALLVLVMSLMVLGKVIVGMN